MSRCIPARGSQLEASQLEAPRAGSWPNNGALESASSPCWPRSRARVFPLVHSKREALRAQELGVAARLTHGCGRSFGSPIACARSFRAVVTGTRTRPVARSIGSKASSSTVAPARSSVEDRRRRSQSSSRAGPQSPRNYRAASASIRSKLMDCRMTSPRSSRTREPYWFNSLAALVQQGTALV
jgi:hypothetical protein